MESTDELLKVSEVELIFKSKIKNADRITVQTSSEVYQVFRQSWDAGKMDLCESAKMLLLNKACKVLGLIELSSGISATIMDPRIIFSAALKANCANIIICHNHPSGNLRPSQADEVMTCRIKEAGRLLDIKLLDHLIITSEGFFSFADEGIL